MATENKSGVLAMTKMMDLLLEDYLLQTQNYQEIAQNNQLHCEKLEECNSRVSKLIDMFSDESFTKDPSGTFAQELTEELNHVKLSIQALNERRDFHEERTEDPDISRTKADIDILRHVFNCKLVQDSDPNVLRGMIEGGKGVAKHFRIDTAQSTKYQVTNLLWDLVAAE